MNLEEARVHATGLHTAKQVADRLQDKRFCSNERLLNPLVFETFYKFICPYCGFKTDVSYLKEES